jgi:N-acetylglucosaminyldiphosphoundecaprenol N-acetyl-beta-D-mannosaminyltransferase
MNSATDAQRIAVLGVGIDPTSYAAACDRLELLVQQKNGGYGIAANVHVVMTARQNPTYARVLSQAAIVTPDGMPLVWALRLLGAGQQQRVYGPDWMWAWCDRAAQKGYRLFLYGSQPQTLTRLEAVLRQSFPTLAIAGSYAPPYVTTIDALDTDAEALRIRESGADVVLVSLGCPKQELWMAGMAAHLSVVMLGVGAAFDFHSGAVRQAPRWLMGLGLEWFFRLLQEPRRLWSRYVLNNPLFLVLLAGQVLQFRLRRWRKK